MGKQFKRTIEVILVLGSLAAIISLFVFWLYPTYIEPAKTDITTLPFLFGVFDSKDSYLGITIKNTGKAHFMSCLKLYSNDQNISFIRDYDCYEFFDKGETHDTQFIVNSTKLFQDNPKNFTLIYSSNTGWKYTCLFVREASNYYKGQNCR